MLSPAFLTVATTSMPHASIEGAVSCGRGQSPGLQSLHKVHGPVPNAMALYNPSAVIERRHSMARGVPSAIVRTPNRMALR